MHIIPDYSDSAETLYQRTAHVHGKRLGLKVRTWDINTKEIKITHCGRDSSFWLWLAPGHDILRAFII